MTEVLGEIKVLIEELKAAAGNSDLARKLMIGDKLATYNWSLADEEARVHAEVNELEYDYKTSVARHVLRATGAATVREAEAKDKFADLQKSLVQKENLLKRLSLLRQQTNIVIEQNRQTCAALRLEFRQTGNG